MKKLMVMAAVLAMVLGVAAPTIVKAAPFEGDVGGPPPCKTGWVCLYQHGYGGGRTLQFQDGHWQNLSTYDFDTNVSSWRNNQYAGDDACLRAYINGKWETRCLPAKGYENRLPPAFDNKATQVRG